MGSEASRPATDGQAPDPAPRRAKWLAIPYLTGRGLDIGRSADKVLPSAFGLRPVTGGNGTSPPDIDPGYLSLFAEGSLDYVFSSDYLHAGHDWRAALREWWRVLRPGGHLVLHLSRVSADGLSAVHLLDATREVMASSGGDVLEDDAFQNGAERGVFQVFRKRSDGSIHLHPWKRRARSCLVIRWGGYGDVLMASSILPLLKEQGWTVALQTTTVGEAVLRHDPNIDEFVVTPPGLVRNEEVEEYWSAVATRYDRVINLTRSCEGVLLKTPLEREYFWPDEARRMICAFNYVELLHAIAGVPFRFEQRFHATEEERTSARAFLGDEPTIVWALAGSAPHKVWPWAAPAIVQLLTKHPTCRVVLVGGSESAHLSRVVVEGASRYHGDPRDRLRTLVGSCSIRESFALAQAADVVVGPETAVLNAVAREPNAKIVILSHSTPLNLTRDWVQTVALEPDRNVAPCHPCHRLHIDLRSCLTVEGAAACAWSVSVEQVVNAALSALGRCKNERVLASLAMAT